MLRGLVNASVQRMQGCYSFGKERFPFQIAPLKIVIVPETFLRFLQRWQMMKLDSALPQGMNIVDIELDGCNVGR